MLNKLPTLAHLMRTLQKMPYITSKNLCRITSYFLELNEEQTMAFCTVLLKAKKDIVHCTTCFSWCERKHECIFCLSKKRDQSIVCLVENWHDLLAIENTEGFNGVYHVLGGVISPLDGINPDDLTIDALVDRVAAYEIKEVIMGLNQTPEGEVTASFIDKKLKKTGVVVSRLARGIPVGYSLESMDRVTVYKALSERIPF